MRLRTHIGRDFDFRSTSNLALFAIVGATGAVAVVMWLTGEPAEPIFFAPAWAFVTWANLREIDPDHNWTALLGAVGAGAWILIDGSQVSVLAIGVLILVGRLVTESTGRRPLVTDLVALGVAALVGFTPEGWIAAFGLAIAIYLDDRFAEESRPIQLVASAAVAAIATVIAALTNAFPRAIPVIEPIPATVAAVLALVLVIRAPAGPTTQVDARHKGFLSQERLHASRSLMGVLVFAMTLLVGTRVSGLVPMGFALLLAAVSNEVELARRRAL